MVWLVWKSFRVANRETDELDGDEENLDTEPLKEVSHECGLLSKAGSGFLNGLLFVYDHVPFRQLGPIVVLILYTVFGGWMFRHLETRGIASRTAVPANGAADAAVILPNGTISDNQTLLAAILTSTTGGTPPPPDPNLSTVDLRRQLYRKEMSRRLWRLKLNNTSPKMREKLAESVWAWYDSKLVDLGECGDRKQSSYSRMDEKDPRRQWTMWNAMFYAATLYTTIGYGNIAPSTVGGRVATIIYALFGIPLVLTILNDWGVLLFRILKYLHLQYIRVKHRRSAWVPVAQEPEQVAELPVSLAVFILVFWLCSCAGIFLIWEDWDYFTSFYFFFISLTTIGLGDVVPRYPQYTLMSFTLVLCGLSVVSMSFNIIQTKIESLFRSLVLGIEQEYWQKQVEPDKSHLNEADGGGAVHASIGVMQLWKNKPLKQRILYRMMDNSKKQMLEDLWEKKANTRNQSTQTVIKTFVTEALQVDMDEVEAETKFKSRKYIYNLSD